LLKPVSGSLICLKLQGNRKTLPLIYYFYRQYKTIKYQQFPRWRSIHVALAETFARGFHGYGTLSRFSRNAAKPCRNQTRLVEPAAFSGGPDGPLFASGAAARILRKLRFELRSEMDAAKKKARRAACERRAFMRLLDAVQIDALGFANEN
jgi:hypothetical protein